MCDGRLVALLLFQLFAGFKQRDCASNDRPHGSISFNHMYAILSFIEPFLAIELEDCVIEEVWNYEEEN